MIHDSFQLKDQAQKTVSVKSTAAFCPSSTYWTKSQVWFFTVSMVAEPLRRERREHILASSVGLNGSQHWTTAT